MRPYHFILILVFATTLLTNPSASADAPTRIGMAGDSTIRDYTGMAESNPSYAELRGWGQYLADYLAPGSVEVLNHGKGGCSSKSFITEGRWDKLLEAKPDIVLIQFGHNDIPNKGPERETIPDVMPDALPAEGLGSAEIDWYRHNMRTYIEQARSAGSTPVIVTPMERRAFTSNGKNVREKNKPWADAAIAVATELKAPVINLNAFSIAKLNELGLDGCLYMHPMREGEIDNTHYNEVGARLYAEEAARQLAALVDHLTFTAQPAASSAPATTVEPE